MNPESSYWRAFYSNFNINNSSNFALFVMNFFSKNDKMMILDAGCGNGRDSYFLSTKHNVIGIDKAVKPIEKLNCNFILDNFVDYDKKNFDMIYSRFTFHSITNKDQEIFLKSVTKPNTFLCIETRSDKDKNTFRYYGDTHYRNFTNIDYLKKLLKENNFEILFIEENKNFAIYKNENPICIRVICKKL